MIYSTNEVTRHEHTNIPECAKKKALARTCCTVLIVNMLQDVVSQINSLIRLNNYGQRIQSDLHFTNGSSCARSFRTTNHFNSLVWQKNDSKRFLGEKFHLSCLITQNGIGAAEPECNSCNTEWRH